MRLLAYAKGFSFFVVAAMLLRSGCVVRSSSSSSSTVTGNCRCSCSDLLLKDGNVTFAYPTLEELSISHVTLALVFYRKEATE